MVPVVGLVVGATVGLAGGVVIAFLRVPVKPLVVAGLYLTPPLTAALVGGIGGFLAGLVLRIVRFGRDRSG